MSFNEHNSLKKIPKIIEQLNFGYSIALVSDAGLPGICDPGENLVKATRLNGLETICIPGACAALTALLASGLPSSKFIFVGFLPNKRSAREEALQRISSSQETTILYESPHRLKKLLLELKSFCGGDRKIHIARELTKKHEEHIGDDIDNLIKFFDEKKIMGEFTLIIEGINLSQNKEFDEIKLKKELHELIDAGLSLSSASKYLAKREKLSKNIIYNLN